MVFFSKLNPAGSAFLYSTYLGGRGNDEILGIAVDSAGNAYLTGFFSQDFRTTGVLKVQVRRGSNSAVQSVRVGAVSPGIFTTNRRGTGAAAILHSSDGGLVSEDSPARAGEVVSVYYTGLGALKTPVASGERAPLPIETQLIPEVRIGGSPAPVLYSGAAPRFVGLYQLNVAVPLNAPRGREVTVVIRVGGATSNTATMAIF